MRHDAGRRSQERLFLRSLLCVLCLAPVAMVFPPGAAEGAFFPSLPAPAPSGIEGRALIGPTRPSQRIDDPRPDSIPYETTLRIVNVADGRIAATVATGRDGRFKLTLPPGEYLVEPAAPPRKVGPRAEPQKVSVLAGKFAPVTIQFDSGVR